MNGLTVAILLVALGLANAHFNWERAKKSFDACKAHTKAEENFDDVMKKDILPKTEKGKCMMACVLQRIGIVGKDYKYSHEGTKASLTRIFSHNPPMVDKALPLAEQCSHADAPGMNKCEGALNLYSCFLKKLAEQHINLKE